MVPKPFEVFLIGDNPAEREIFVAAFEHIGSPHHLTVATNGRMALDILFSSETPYSPDLILLARGLPRLSPSDVLKALKADERSCTIPVMVIGSQYDARMANLELAEYFSGRMQALGDYFELAKRIESLLTEL